MTESTKGTRWTYRAREAVGVFRDPAALEAAVDELEIAGFDRAAISVLGTEAHSGPSLEGLFKTVRQIEDDKRAPHAAFVSSDSRTEGEALIVGGPFYIGGVAGAIAVAAAGGALAFAFAAAIATGAAAAGIGGLLVRTIERRYHDKVEEQLKLGGLVLWVGVGDADAEGRATAALKKAGADDIHVHEIEREWDLQDLPLADAQPDPILEHEALHDEKS